jgi:hypothetical protein
MTLAADHAKFEASSFSMCCCKFHHELAIDSPTYLLRGLMHQAKTVRESARKTSRTSHLCPFELAFRGILPQRHLGPLYPLAANRDSAREEMTLLILTAGVLRRFRFASTVTILQHDKDRLVTRSSVRE